MQEQIDNPQERAEMIFMLAILAGRKYNTVGFKLLSPLVTAMNIETLRDDPTAKDLIHRLYPDEIATAEAKGEAKGAKKATEDYIHRLDGMLSKEQMKQVFGENVLASQEEPKKST